MSNKFVVATLTAAMLCIPQFAQAGTSCKSTWVKSTAKFKTFFVPVAKVVCKQLNTDDEEAAKKCIENVEKFAKVAEDLKTEWNKGEHGSWKIGPRALPNDRPQTGTVSTERQFIGVPVLNEDYKLTMRRTGGKAKRDLIVKVCFVDESGNDVEYKEFRLNKNGNKSINHTFSGVAGTFPLIHLNNQRWGANGHKYIIEGEAQGEPQAVVQARKTLKKAKAKPGKRKIPVRRRR